MEEEEKLIKKKYMENVKKIIKRYSNCEDDELNIVDVFDFEEDSAVPIDSISFIRKEQETLCKNSPVVIFQDVYRMMCTKCDFEDIYRILQ